MERGERRGVLYVSVCTQGMVKEEVEFVHYKGWGGKQQQQQSPVALISSFYTPLALTAVVMAVREDCLVLPERSKPLALWGGCEGYVLLIKLTSFRLPWSGCLHFWHTYYVVLAAKCTAEAAPTTHQPHPHPHAPSPTHLQ